MSQNNDIVSILQESIDTISTDIDKCFEAAIRHQVTNPDRAMTYQRRGNVLNVCCAGIVQSKRRLNDVKALLDYYSTHEFNMQVKPVELTDEQWTLITEVAIGNPLAKLDDSFVLFKSLLTYPM